MNKSILLDMDGEALLVDMLLVSSGTDFKGQPKDSITRAQMNEVLKPYYATISEDLKYIDFESIRDKSYFLLKFF